MERSSVMESAPESQALVEIERMTRDDLEGKLPKPSSASERAASRQQASRRASPTGGPE
jgi:hypothetical protein